MTPANDLREALARVVSDQRRDADLIVNDIYTVLEEYGTRVTHCEKCGQFFDSRIWSCPFFECKGDPVEGRWVLPLPDQEPTT